MMEGNDEKSNVDLGECLQVDLVEEESRDETSGDVNNQQQGDASGRSHLRRAAAQKRPLSDDYDVHISDSEIEKRVQERLNSSRQRETIETIQGDTSVRFVQLRSKSTAAVFR